MLHIPIFERHLAKAFIKLVLDYQILLVLLILVLIYTFTLHIENINVLSMHGGITIKLHG